MKILHLLQSSNFSGAENVVCHIIDMFLDNTDFEMAYCSQDGQIREALAERKIKFYPMTVLKITEVKRVIKDYKPDVIHAHDMRASFIAALLCGKIPLVSHIHNNAFDSRCVSLKSIAFLLTSIKANHIFWVSQSSFNGFAFNKLLKKKSSILLNIIDINALYKKMEKDTNVYEYEVVYLGRLAYPKNPQRLIDVLENVVKHRPETKIAIVGTGNLEVEIRNIVDKKQLVNNVFFLGFQSNPYKIIHDSKVMIMTSRWEGTPMCALEAMALSLPIVSTPTDGLCSLISNGDNGFLSEDDEILAERILDIVTNRDLQLKMGRSAKSSMEILMNKKNYVSSIEKVYIQSQE